MDQTEAFHQRIDSALANEQARTNFRTAMTGLMEKRAESLNDEDELQALRDHAAAIRAHSLANLPELLEQIDQRMTANGIQVHWAETG
jgi:L-lactate dehydrogenase complex protein LldF